MTSGKNPTDKKPRTLRCKDSEYHSERTRRGNSIDGGNHDRRTPQGLTGTWVKSKCVKGGGCTVTGNGDRRRHAARGAYTSGGGWQVAGAGNVQVGGTSRKERMWKSGTNRERGSTMNCCWWEGVGWRKDKNNPVKL